MRWIWGLLVVLAAGIGFLFGSGTRAGRDSEPVRAELEPAASRRVEQALAAPSTPQVESGPHRVPLQTAEARRPAARAADSRTGALLREFEQAWNAGLVEEEEEERLLQALVSGHLRAQDPEGAFGVLERYGSQNAQLYGFVARKFQHQGKAGQAALAFERALTLTPENQQFARKLIRLTPEIAVDVLSSALVTMEGPQLQQAKTSLAVGLEAAGRRAEAARTALELLEENPTSKKALAVLGRVQPLEAERRLREFVLHPENGDAWSSDLARFLARQDRKDEAADILLAQLERGSEYADAGELIEVAPVRAFLYLDRAASQGRLDEDASEHWGDVAEILQDAGDKERSLEAWTRAILSEQEDPDEYVNALRRRRPEALIPLLEQRVDTGANDEFWGSLADAYWRAGRRHDAVRAWDQAHRMDPDDDEWTGKLEAVTEDRDPLE